MISLYSKILAILLLFIGESIAIYSEMIAAKTYSVNSKPFLQIFLKMFLVAILAGGFLIVGYMLGFSAFKNIWIVSVTSITSILIMEPILAYTIFHQLPTKGAIIGFILGVLGFVASILI
jgi:hypothetical protein